MGVLDVFKRRGPVELRYSKDVGGGRLASYGGYSLSRLAQVAPRHSPVLYRAVQAISANAASLDLIVEDRDGERVDLPEVTDWFNRWPNPNMSARVFKETIWLKLELSETGAFIYVDRGATGKGPIQALVPIYDPVEIVLDGDDLIGYRIHRSGSLAAVPLLPSECMYLHYPDPDDPWAHMSPLRAAAQTAELDEVARAWQRAEFRNGARPSNVVHLGDIDEETAGRIVASFESRHEGVANAGRSLFLWGEGQAKVDRMSMSPKEMSYIDTRKINAEELALAFGVPMDLLRGGSTYENQRQAKVNLWTDTILPKLEIVAGEVDRQLIPDLEHTAKFDISEVDAFRENEDALVARVTTAAESDLYTVDEARELLGLEPLPDKVGEVTLTVYRASVGIMTAMNGLTPSEAVNAATQEATEEPPGSPEAPDGADTPSDDPVTTEGNGEATERTGAAPIERRGVMLTEAEILREFDRLEARGVATVRRLAEKQARVVISRLERSKKGAPEVRAANPDDLFDVPYWIEYTRDAMEPYLAATYDAGGTAAAMALGLDFGLYDPQVTAAMRRRLDELAEVVTRTTYQVLSDRLLEPGVEAGEGVPKLADRIKSVFDDLATWRAETIARTETVGGFNEAAQGVAVGSGQVVRRRWKATSDSRTRDSHQSLNGYETNGLEDRYPNGVRFPGDPAGPPDETINCRCVELFITKEPS